MPVRTFDPKQFNLLVGGIPIGGYADGTFISFMRSNDTFTKVSGTDGIVSRALSADTSGEIVITLAQTSPSNDALSAIHTADEISGDGVVPVLIEDKSGRTKALSAFAWIRKPADSEFGKEIANREWTLDCADFDVFIGGNSNAE